MCTPKPDGMSLLDPLLDLLPEEIRHYLRCAKASISSIKFEDYIYSMGTLRLQTILEEIREVAENYIAEKQDLGLTDTCDLAGMHLAHTRADRVMFMLRRGMTLPRDEAPTICEDDRMVHRAKCEDQPENLTRLQAKMRKVNALYAEMSEDPVFQS